GFVVRGEQADQDVDGGVGGGDEQAAVKALDQRVGLAEAVVDRAAGAGGGVGDDDRDPDCAADLEAGGDDACGGAGHVVGDVDHGRYLGGHVEGHQPESEQDQSRHDPGPVAGVGIDLHQ